MRSNSGNDQSRDNLRDPTLRDRTEERTPSTEPAKATDATAPADHRSGRKD